MYHETIVTGQQIGLLGGPLYTCYKVLGAVRLARQENRNPVYWLETNDADFHEISSIDFIDRDGRLRHLQWQKETGGQSCGHILVDSGLIEILETFFGSLTPTEYTMSLKSLVLSAYREGRELGDASLELARALYPFPDLLFFDPRDPEFRQFCRGFLLPLFEATPSGEQCPGFIDDNGIRRAVFRSESGYHLREGKAIDLKDYTLLPNVHTRPLCQDAYFQTSAYIAGPGEMAYLSPLSDLYRQNGVSQPRLIPRMSVTLIEPWSQRQLQKLDIDPKVLLNQGFSEARKNLLTRHEGFDLKAIERQSEALCQGFVTQMTALHPDFASLRQGVRQEIKLVMGSIRKNSRERNAGDLEKLEKLFMRLKPNEKPQERVFNLFYYMNLYGGLDFVTELLKRYDPKAVFLEVL